MFFVRTLFALAACGPMALAAAAVHADDYVCQGLRQEYAAAVSQSGSQSGDNVRLQLSRAEGAAEAGNCRRFLFFGPPRSPACPAIMATIDRLQQQISESRYGGFSFGAGGTAADLREALAQNGCAIPNASAALNGSGGRTLCVRTCDGYYFPISGASRRSRYKIDAAVCQSMYTKDGQAELFIEPQGTDDVGEAQSLTGTRYADEPYAFLYRKSYDAACHAELKGGMASLADRYDDAAKSSQSTASVTDTDSTDGLAIGIPPENSADPALADTPASTPEPSAAAPPPSPEASAPSANAPSQSVDVPAGKPRIVGDPSYVKFLSEPPSPPPPPRKSLLPSPIGPAAAEAAPVQGTGVSY